jgi:hypothetical protein
MSKSNSPLPPLDPQQRYTVEEAIRYLRSSRASVQDTGYIARVQLMMATPRRAFLRSRCRPPPASYSICTLANRSRMASWCTKCP